MSGQGVGGPHANGRRGSSSGEDGSRRRRPSHAASSAAAAAPSSSSWAHRRESGFMRVAARFYLISKPFWTAKQHASGFEFYNQDEDDADEEGGHSNGSAVSEHSQPAAASSGVASTSSVDSLSPDEPQFQHTKLNSPALIPRALGGARGSSDSTVPSGSAIGSGKPAPLNIQLEPISEVGTGAASGTSKRPRRSGGAARSSRSWRNGWGVSDRIYRFFHRTPRRIAWSWSLLMLALLVACTYLHVLMSYCQRNMSTALAERQAEKFYASLWGFLGAIMLASPLLSISQYAKSQLALHWRIYLTNEMLQQYFYRRNYFYLQPGNMAGAGAAAAAALNASLASDAAHDQANGASSSKKGSSKSGRSKSKSKSGGSGGGHVDNPDQRICDDIRAFTRSSLTFVNELLDEIFQVVAFAGILYSISPLLVFGLLAYAGLGTYLATAVFGLRLIAVNSKQSKLEADFRFSLVRVRTNAEAIAFYSGEKAELSYIYWRFAKIVRNLSEMAGVQCNLALFKHAYGFATMLIPPFVLAPMYFRGEVELGVINQSAMAFRQIFNSLNMVVSKMNELSKWRSGMERIWQLEQSLLRQQRIAEAHNMQRRRSISIEAALAKPLPPDDPTAVWWSDEAAQELVPAHATIQMRQSPHLRLEHLRVCVQGDPSDVAATEGASPGQQQAPQGDRILVQNLNLYLPSLQQLSVERLLSLPSPSSLGGGVSPSIGRGLLVMGRSGIGKSTLLRAIAGLWKNGSGTIHRPDLSSLLFLPQRPYMILGTLRQQLLYPFCPQSQKTSVHPVAAAVAPPHKEAGAEVEQVEELSSSLPSSPALGLRRRWPTAGTAASAVAALTTPFSPTFSENGDGLSAIEPPSLCPSPPPPTSSTTLEGGLAVEREGMPSDADLEHILGLVNLSHLTRDYSGRARVQQGADSPRKRTASATAATASSSSDADVAVAGLDALCDWSDVLSLGEAQRIAFARILIHQPSFVFCDEITAALDAHNEEHLYSALAKYAPRTCLVSVGHRPALLRHHSHVLHLLEGGRWQLLEINDANAQAIDRITALTTTA